MEELWEMFEPETLIAAGAAILLAIVVVVLLVFVLRNRRRARASDLEERFGAEYQRAIDASGSRRRAEEGLAERAERRQRYELRTLDDDTRDEYRERWAGVQAGFVDGPPFTVHAGLELVRVVAVARGYPDDGLERILDDVSVDHPELVAGLRRSRGDDGRAATTEHHREAFIFARAIFERLVGEGETRAMEARSGRPEAIHAPSRSTLSVESDETEPGSSHSDPREAPTPTQVGQRPAPANAGPGAPSNQAGAPPAAPDAEPAAHKGTPPPPPVSQDPAEPRPLSGTGGREGSAG